MAVRLRVTASGSPIGNDPRVKDWDALAKYQKDPSSNAYLWAAFGYPNVPRRWTPDIPADLTAALRQYTIDTGGSVGKFVHKWQKYGPYAAGAVMSGGLAYGLSAGGGLTFSKIPSVAASKAGPLASTGAKLSVPTTFGTEAAVEAPSIGGAKVLLDVPVTFGAEGAAAAEAGSLAAISGASLDVPTKFAVDYSFLEPQSYLDRVISYIGAKAEKLAVTTATSYALRAISPTPGAPASSGGSQIFLSEQAGGGGEAGGSPGGGSFTPEFLQEVGIGDREMMILGAVAVAAFLWARG